MTKKFHLLLLQVESWVRSITDVDNLKANSFVKLKDTLLDYRLLSVAWAKIMGETNNSATQLMLDHVVGLFLNIRGFAIFRLIRKQLQHKQKVSKHAAGSRKALRKELKVHSTN